MKMVRTQGPLLTIRQATTPIELESHEKPTLPPHIIIINVIKSGGGKEPHIPIVLIRIPSRIDLMHTILQIAHDKKLKKDITIRRDFHTMIIAIEH